MQKQFVVERGIWLRTIALCGSLGLLCWGAVLTVGPAASGQDAAANVGEAALDRIVVTITVGEQGEALTESVDVHLGLGFPLRLFPLGTDRRTPAFAAFPRSSSVKEGTNSLNPGETATFVFEANPDSPGLDILWTTPELFRDLGQDAPKRVGFASLGQSDWVLKGFQVEVNGRTVASSRNADLRPRNLQRENQARLQERMAEFEVLLPQVTALEATALTGLATDGELVRLQELQDQLESLGNEVNTLAAIVLGALPWHTEVGSEPPENRIRAIDVTLTPQDRSLSGSRNPLYLWIDGRKFALSTEADPLANGAIPQSFRISTAELDANPIVRDRVRQIGIGMVANDEPQANVADRVRLKRVQVLVDGQPLYDSEANPDDQQTLKRIAFVPPARRNGTGVVRPQRQPAPLVTFWKSGSLLPEGAADAPPLPEEPAPESLENVPVDPANGEPSPGELAGPPALPPPAIILAPFENSGLNSPRRRRLAKRGGRTPIVLNITTPSVPAARNPRLKSAASGAGAPRPLVSTPAPAAPVLTSIRINPAIPILKDGNPAVVTWQVAGPITSIASYRVDLFGVLPHKNRPLINTPLATLANIPPNSGSGTQSMIARLPAIQVSKISGQLSGAEAQYLYAQPKVTALSSNGTAIVSGFGSILPLFPASANTPYPGALVPGQVVANGLPVVANVPPPSFQILPASAPALPWRSSPALDPLTSSTAWPLNTEQDSSHALTFASYIAPTSVAPLPACNAAVRPANNGERVSIQYEGPVALPSALPTPVKGWRLVGHVAFLGGTAPATALVQTRVNLFNRPATPNPFFTMQTPAPMTYSKFSSGTSPSPCLLIDMPIRFDLMAANNLAASPHDASKYQITTFNPNGPTGFVTVGNAGGGQTVYLQATFMIAMQSTTTTDAVGVFGLRLVPDNN